MDTPGIELDEGGRVVDFGTPDIRTPGPLTLLQIAKDTIIGVSSGTEITGDPQHAAAEAALQAQGETMGAFIVRDWTAYLVPVGLPIAIGWAAGYFWRRPIKRQLRRIL